VVTYKREALEGISGVWREVFHEATVEFTGYLTKKPE